jgi:6-phosphogluconolactonase
MKYLILILAYLIGNQTIAQNNSEKYLIVGTYTSGKSEGIYVYKFNTQTGDFKEVSIAKNIVNPSFLAISQDEKMVYSVGEIDKSGVVHAFGFDKKTGQLNLKNTASSVGSNSCHVAIDKTGQWVIVGNYSSGNLSVFKTLADGTLSQAVQTIQHTGKGANLSRQDQAHVHSINIAPNNTDVFVPDLGIDKVVNYRLDPKTGQLLPNKQPFAKVQDGSGPRHFTIHPNGKFAYVIQELSGQITSFDYRKGQLKAVQTLSTMPKDYVGDYACADIHISPDGKFLYGSNRGNNTLAIYALDPKTGLLTYLANEPVMGKRPRNFMIDPTGNFVLVANQDSNTITIFRRDAQSGLLTYTGKTIAVPTPVCLKMLAVE